MCTDNVNLFAEVISANYWPVHTVEFDIDLKISLCQARFWLIDRKFASSTLLWINTTFNRGGREVQQISDKKGRERGEEIAILAETSFLYGP